LALSGRGGEGKKTGERRVGFRERSQVTGAMNRENQGGVGSVLHRRKTHKLKRVSPDQSWRISGASKSLTPKLKRVQGAYGGAEAEVDNFVGVIGWRKKGASQRKKGTGVLKNKKVEQTRPKLAVGGSEKRGGTFAAYQSPAGTHRKE